MLNFILELVRFFVAGLFCFVIFFYVLLPLFRGLREPLSPPERQIKKSKPITELENWLSTPDPPKETQQIKNNSKILDEAKQKPQKTALIIKAWLRENKK